MVQVPVYNAEGKEVRKHSFDESVFGEKVLTKTLHEVVVAYARNQRQGNHSVKTRANVAGSNRKLWRQKGTGRARVGDRRPPHWRGGGIAHGPHTKDYWRRIPTRMRQTALRSALLSKLKDGEVAIVEGFDFSAGPKTRLVATFLSNSGTSGSALFANHAHDDNFLKSVRNVQKVSLTEVRELNAYEVMRHGKLVLTAEALQALAASHGKQEQA